MSTSALKPWIDTIKLHPDVESGNLTEAVFAIDLGAIAANDPNVPAVNRDPESFFRATYLTHDLRKLLEEVLASLAGKTGYNRVIKLRTPFGGGKSHTLAALLHATRNRKALKLIQEAKDFADPGKVAVAVFDGEKLDARSGKKIEDGRTIKTMWGWLAWQLGEDKYKLVEKHDNDRVSPGGDVIKQMLEGKPVLLLLDEVLKYMERASAVSVHESTLRRQALDFFQNLTVEVARSKQAVLVYSLQWSSREAMDNVALLQELDKMAARVDQLREPVTGDDILPILQRRLLGGTPSRKITAEIATAFSEEVTSMLRAYAPTAPEKQRAEQDGISFRKRMQAAYPFHPSLIDIMKERWTSIDDYQRTRGALRFLASCLHSVKKSGKTQPLVAPGSIPLDDINVRVQLVKELGVQNTYDAVITADIEGPNARAKLIDQRMASETPALASIRPATRLSTAILLYSFGGLRREDDDEEKTLPPGVTESELLSACVGPGFDSLTAKAVLGELKNHCLYLHYDGVRYCFKKDPNVTKLIEDAEQEVSREDVRRKEQGPVHEKIKEMLEKRLAGHHDAVIWPKQSQDISDEEPRFIIGYLPLSFANLKKSEQEQQAIEFLTNFGSRQRKYRNGLGLAIPDKKHIESLRRAVRYLLAIERVESRKNQYRLTKEQRDQLRERNRTEMAAAEGAFRELYNAVWLPRVDAGKIELEKVERGGRPLQATGVHERLMEILTNLGTKRVHTTVTARKICERVMLGETVSGEKQPRLGIMLSDVQYSFYAVLEPPRLDSVNAIRKGVCQGVEEGMFAYASGAFPELDAEGKFQINMDKVVFEKSLSEDEVDFDSGFIIMPSALPKLVEIPVGVGPEDSDTGDKTGADDGGHGTGAGGETGEEHGETQKVYCATFSASRDQVFSVFPAIANLADRSDDGKVVIQVEGKSEKGYDPSWLRNAVKEPLDEADVDFHG